MVGKAVAQNNGKYSVYAAYMPDNDKDNII